jgi:thioredoxin reductase (NADPH)
MKNYDIAIIGGGAAGLSAAIAAGSKNRSVVIFDHFGFIPRLRKQVVIQDYPGLPNITGSELTKLFLEQAKTFNPTLIAEKVLSIDQEDVGFSITTPKNTVQATTIILANGSPKTTILQGEKDFIGRGISYCATYDMPKFKDKKIAVISTDPVDMNEIEALAEVSSKVLLFPIYDMKRAKVVPKHKNIEILNDFPKEITGTSKVTGIRTISEAYFAIQGVFILRESDPIDVLLPNLRLTGKYVMTYKHLATNIPGIFAAGDCTGQPWHIAKAVGEGQVAALGAINLLNKI